MKARLVQIAFSNGVTVVGIVPAAMSDADLAAAAADHIDLCFSDMVEVAYGTPTGAVLEKLSRAVFCNEKETVH